MAHDFCKICKRDSDCDNREECLKSPRLNLGSGLMIRKDSINFDQQELSQGGRYTDVLGDAFTVDAIFEENAFAEILAFHIIEHFRREYSQILLKKLHFVLRKGGKLIMEGPSITGAYRHYIVNGKGGERGFANELFSGLSGSQARKIYGKGSFHRSGWTENLMAEEMEELCGFKIIHKGIGLSHGMGIRDFRVEGIKI